MIHLAQIAQTNSGEGLTTTQLTTHQMPSQDKDKKLNSKNLKLHPLGFGKNEEFFKISNYSK
jgi:hypothetical protein